MSSIISKLINLAGNITGTLGISNGGTGQTSANAAFNALSPMTTAGDLIYGGASGAGTRLPAGSTSQVLVGGTTPSWGNIPSGAIPTATPSATGVVTAYTPIIMSSVDTVTNANYVAGNTDGYKTILMSAGSSNRTVTLPSPSSNTGRTFVIKKIDSGSGIVTIGPNASETIDGQSSAYLNGQYAYVSLVTDGTNWFIKDGFNLSPVGTLGTITFQGGTPPSSQTMADYRWSQVGNMVTISWFFSYSSVGSGVSSYFFTMPSDVPTPLNWPSATTNPNAGATSTFSGTSTILGVALTDFNDAVPSGWAVLVEHASGTGISTARGSVTFPTAVII